MVTNLSVKYSPDAARIAMGGSKGVLRLLAADTREEQSAVAVKLGIFSLDYSPDGTAIAVGGGGYDSETDSFTGYLAIHDADTGAVRTTFEAEKSIKSVVFSPDGGMLAAGEPGALTVIRLDSKEQRVLFSESDKTAFMADGSLVTLDSGEVRLVGGDGEIRAALPCENATFRIVGSRDGNFLAIDTFKPAVRVMSGEGEIIGEFSITIPTPAVALSPDGRLLALAHASKIRIIDTSTRKALTKKTESPAYALDFSPDGRSLAWGDSAEALHVIDLR
jgi:WD40 repeat protein